MTDSSKARFNQEVLAFIKRRLGRDPKVNDRVHVIIDGVDLTFRIYRVSGNKISMHSDCPETVQLPDVGQPRNVSAIIYGVTLSQQVV